MWIEYTNTTDDGRPAVSALTVDGERVEFSENGKANVSSDLGERLVADSAYIEASGSDAGGSDSAADLLDDGTDSASEASDDSDSDSESDQED